MSLPGKASWSSSSSSPATELQRVRWHPALGDLAAGEPVTRTLRSIYFDTPDHRLQGAGHLLAPAVGRRGWLQTVKSGTAVHGRRCPTRSRPRPPSSGRSPTSGSSATASIRRKVEKAVERSILEPVFETVVERTTRQLHSGRRRAGAGARRRRRCAPAAPRMPLCEAELELKSGAPECLLQTAAQLFAAEPVRLAERSKAERGYNLALGRTNGHAHVEPQRGELPELREDHTCAEAFALIVQSAADQIAANRHAVLETVDPAAAHQLRIGLRRLRSALSAFRPLARHAGPARAGRPRPGSRPHGRRAARRRRADRADLCAGGRRPQGRSGLAAPARGAARRTAPACASGCGRRSKGSNGRCCSFTWRCGRAPSRAPRRCRRRSASSPAPP